MSEMNPFYFDAEDRRLFGIYHSPDEGDGDDGSAGASGVKPGILLCSPVAQEYMRCHWALRKLTQLLTRSGYAVFRFDYSGTGDSSGEFSQVTWENWKTDLRMALHEFKAVSGVRKVSLVGLRLGAALAAEVCAEGPMSPIQELILWDPVVKGADYLAQLKKIHLQSLTVSRKSPPTLLPTESYGYEFSSALIESLRKLKLPVDLKVRKIQVIISEASPACASWAARAGIPAAQLQVIADDGQWDELDKATGALLASKIPQAILGALNARGSNS